MSDEEESMSDGFSASEDEWKPSKEIKGGESSDDDDSDYEGSPLTGAASGSSVISAGRKRGEPKGRSATKQTSSKKRTGLSLRTKLYNKYRPPPKTFSPPASTNSPSTSYTKSKNAAAPNESRSIICKNDESGSSSDSSINNYLVNPEDLDIHSSFFNVEAMSAKKSVSPEPVFDCNAGLENLSDSVSEEEEQGGIKKKDKAFDFSNLLEYANTLERVKEEVKKHNAAESSNKESATSNIDNLDVYAVLALGEKQNNPSHNDGEDEDDEDDEAANTLICKNQPLKLNKTKSTRIKRHTKTRPISTIAANDTDDSDWEEVADTSEAINTTATSGDVSRIGNLEIHVEMPSRNKENKIKTQQDIELAFKRKLNREIRERQVLLHKVSLLCHLGRSYVYNRLLNDPILMNKALKLLPSKSSYPNERGTEIKYFQSLVTWFKSVIKLKTQNLYPGKGACKTITRAHMEILKQIEEKEARSKQDMIFIFIILLRGMGLQCRLVVNIQPLPLKPAASDLISLTSNSNDKIEDKGKISSVCSKSGSKISNNIKDTKEKSLPLQKTKQNDSDKRLEQKGDAKKTSEIKNGNEKGKISKNNISLGIAKERIEQEKNKIDVRVTKRGITENENPNEKEEVNIKTYSKSRKVAKICLKDGDIQNESDKFMKNIKTVDTKLISNESSTTLTSKQLPLERNTKELEGSQKENKVSQPKGKTLTDIDAKQRKLPSKKAGSNITSKSILQPEKYSKEQSNEQPSTSRQVRNTRSSSKSPQPHLSTTFLFQNNKHKQIFPNIIQKNINVTNKSDRSKTTSNKVKISGDFLKKSQKDNLQKRVLRPRQKTDKTSDNETNTTEILPQLDGANDSAEDGSLTNATKSKKCGKKRTKIKQLKVKSNIENSDDDFEPSPSKKPKSAPAPAKQNRRVLSSDSESDNPEKSKRKQTAGDMWLEVWCDVEEQWICVDIFKGKIHCIDTIRKSATPNFAYVFAFQNNLSIKDVTARYCHNWSTVVRKSRVEKAWLDAAISQYLGHKTKRDIKEDEELRRIHEDKPMPTSIADYKNHPFFVLERHLLKFEALYPPNAPALGFVRGEAVYSRDCVHTLHSREIWLKQAKTVKLGEKPYKIVKARPKWDRVTQTVIKDQPLELFGYWQTQDYEPPTAENGLVPRNAYGNVELFKPSMLPKKTVHLRLPGLNRICKKLNIDCANAVVGFDFHQGACHPLFDGFVVCEEFEDVVIAAWHQDQEEQDRKEQEKYEARVYGNWKKLIRGLLIRERLKLKYNF